MIGIKASSIQIGGGSCDYPAYVASAETYSTSGSNCVINKPSGTTEGDLMVAIIQFNANTTITPPTDWIQIDEDDGISSVATVIIYYKIAGASEPSDYTWTASSTRHGGIIATFSGSFDSDPSNGAFSYVYISSAVETDVSADAMTLADGCAMVIYAGAYDQVAASVWTPPLGWDDACANAGGNNVYLGYKTFENSGSTGSVGYSIDETNAYKIAWLWSFVTNT